MYEEVLLEFEQSKLERSFIVKAGYPYQKKVSILEAFVRWFPADIRDNIEHNIMAYRGVRPYFQISAIQKDIFYNPHVKVATLIVCFESKDDDYERFRGLLRLAPDSPSTY